MLKTQTIHYLDGDTKLEAYCAFDDKETQKKPGVLIAHDWSGRNTFACSKADKLAELGYVGFAIDMYGKAKIGANREENTALMTPFMKDRSLLQQRILAAYHAIKKIEAVDPSRIGVIGFCFGGLCALDLARAGADLKGAVSFHGLLSAPDNRNRPIKAKVLVLHGHDDPTVPPEQVLQFEREMTEAKVDWQVHTYGLTMHGFANPSAKDPSTGIFYNKSADIRSWLAMKNFFAEVFESA